MVSLPCKGGGASEIPGASAGTWLINGAPLGTGDKVLGSGARVAGPDARVVGPKSEVGPALDPTHWQPYIVSFLDIYPMCSQIGNSDSM